MLSCARSITLDACARWLTNHPLHSRSVPWQHLPVYAHVRHPGLLTVACIGDMETLPACALTNCRMIAAVPGCIQGRRQEMQEGQGAGCPLAALAVPWLPFTAPLVERNSTVHGSSTKHTIPSRGSRLASATTTTVLHHTAPLLHVDQPCAHQPAPTHAATGKDIYNWCTSDHPFKDSNITTRCKATHAMRTYHHEVTLIRRKPKPNRSAAIAHSVNYIRAYRHYRRWHVCVVPCRTLRGLQLPLEYNGVSRIQDYRYVDCLVQDPHLTQQ